MAIACNTNTCAHSHIFILKEKDYKKTGKSQTEGRVVNRALIQNITRILQVRIPVKQNETEMDALEVY